MNASEREHNLPLAPLAAYLFFRLLHGGSLLFVPLLFAQCYGYCYCFSWPAGARRIRLVVLYCFCPLMLTPRLYTHFSFVRLFSRTAGSTVAS